MEDSNLGDGLIHESEFEHNEFHKEVVTYMKTLGFYIGSIHTLKNNFQKFKGNVYLNIDKFISTELANFLRRISPVLRAPNNRDHSIWFHFRDKKSHKLIKEILFTPSIVSLEGEIYIKHIYILEMYVCGHNKRVFVKDLGDVSRFLCFDSDIKPIVRKNVLDQILS